MKQRIEIARALKYETADEVRRNLEEENPERVYQVRKFRGGYKVVERVDTSGTN